MKTTEKHLESQLKVAECQTKIDNLNVELDRLHIYEIVVYAALLGSVICLMITTW